MKKIGILLLFCMSFHSTRGLAIQNVLFTQTKFEIKTLGVKNLSSVGEIEVHPVQNDSEILLRSELLSQPITLHLRNQGSDRFDIFVKPMALPDNLSFFQTKKENQPLSILIGEGSCGKKICKLSVRLEKIIKVKGTAQLDIELVPTGSQTVHFMNTQIDFGGLEKKSAVFHLRESGQAFPPRRVGS